MLGQTVRKARRLGLGSDIAPASHRRAESSRVWELTVRNWRTQRRDKRSAVYFFFFGSFCYRAISIMDADTGSMERRFRPRVALLVRIPYPRSMGIVALHFRKEINIRPDRFRITRIHAAAYCASWTVLLRTAPTTVLQRQQSRFSRPYSSTLLSHGIMLLVKIENVADSEVGLRAETSRGALDTMYSKLREKQTVATDGRLWERCRHRYHVSRSWSQSNIHNATVRFSSCELEGVEIRCAQ